MSSKPLTPTQRLILLLGPRLLGALLRLLALTYRMEMIGAEDLFERWDRGEKLLFSFWHNRLLVMPLFARNRRVCILISGSRDGELATRTLARWSIHAVRGSATRGGARGFLEMLRAYRHGYSLALVPDGPRGPLEQVKPGVIHLARATGGTLFPVSYAASRCLRLKSWDRLIVPLPFARIVLAVGEPMQIARDLDDAALEQNRLRLEQQLIALGHAAETALQ